MEKRNLFVAIGIGMFVLAIAVFLLMRKPANNSGGVQNDNQTMPTTPSSVVLPTETTAVSQQNIQTVQKEVEKIVQEPITTKVIKEGSKLVQPKDQNNVPIPLADFEKAVGISIYPQLGNMLDSKDYRFFYCPTANNEKDFGIYLGYNVPKAYIGLYKDTFAWMKAWEQTMLGDLHAVLFPQVNFSQSELAEKLQFKDGKYRYAEITLPNGKSSSINYRVSDNGVIVTTSPECLDRLVKIYEPQQP